MAAPAPSNNPLSEHISPALSQVPPPSQQPNLTPEGPAAPPVSSSYQIAKDMRFRKAAPEQRQAVAGVVSFRFLLAIVFRSSVR